ncbi:hypothetical protein FHX44_117192 [Pseudonocardia hierapolitana]|uniref:Uncharacterized protein n=1 Tax=Pseudonocardia hierapolitana TaxID=1128676 RepID=A0A561T2B4_9PSEU|nr:hypothetical protein [Pseudonocardia hierapolitana]TWF81249.1 hypothetical protein FHX44_117192 [Pseudonocardia hierapolitana]
MTGGGGAARIGGLEGELAQRGDAEGRIATSLVELERHPGHALLSKGRLTGRTAREWTQASAELAGLWQDFDTYRRVLADARAALARGADDPELHRLLREPSIEVGRSVVERRLTGTVERVDAITLADLAGRMDAAYDRVHALFVTADDLHEAFLAAIGPLAERLRAARRLAAELEDTRVAELTARVEELTARGTTDPLSLADAPPDATLAELGARVDALTADLARTAAARDAWNDHLARVGDAIAELQVARAAAEQVRLRAQELVVTAPLDPPPDRTAALRGVLAALIDGRLPSRRGWPARARALADLEAEVDAAATEVRTAHELADGLLERRSELRGRFEAYRAKAGRLGLSERPDLLALDTDVRRLLWTRPADLAAATRALVSYRQLLVAGDTGDIAGRPA